MIVCIESYCVAVCCTGIDDAYPMAVVAHIDILCLIHRVSWVTNLSIVLIVPEIISIALYSRNEKCRLDQISLPVDRVNDGQADTGV